VRVQSDEPQRNRAFARSLFSVDKRSDCSPDALSVGEKHPPFEPQQQKPGIGFVVGVFLRERATSDQHRASWTRRSRPPGVLDLRLWAFHNHHVMGRAQASAVIRLALAGTLAFSIVSCASFKERVGGWFGAKSPAAIPVTSASQERRAYYAKAEGLQVYIEPSASSKVVGSLSLQEKVLRTKVERGYAYVESTKSGVKGWVDNAKLTWRPPGAATAAPSTPPAAGAQRPAAPAGEEPREPAASPETTVTTVTEPPPTTTTVLAPRSDSKTPSPSILDSY
jgi:hypothetical protein